MNEGKEHCPLRRDRLPLLFMVKQRLTPKPRSSAFRAMWQPILVSEGLHRPGPWVPGKVDRAEFAQEIARLLEKRLQAWVLDLPLALEPANDELAVPTHRE